MAEIQYRKIDPALLVDIADAIRAKNGSSDTYTPAEMADAIDALQTGGAAPVLQAKTGITPTKASQTITPDSGYDGLSSVQINAMPSGSASTPATTITANPGISVNSSTGLITAAVSASQNVTPTVSAGYVSAGTAGTVSVSGSNTEQLSTQAAATITPSTSSQVAVAAGKYTTGAVTVDPIPSQYIVPSGSQTLTENDTYDVTALASVTVEVPSSGATNYVTGSFTTGSTTGTVETVTIPYTGSGYPIAAMVFIKGGAYNNTSTGDTNWYNSTQRYAVGQWTMHKAVQSSTPTYSTSGTANQGVTAWIYKNSTSTATTYSRSSAMSTNTFSSSNATGAGATCVRFKSSTSMSIYVASTSYGLLADTEYEYHIIYSS